MLIVFFFSSRRRHTRWPRDWSSDVCSSDLSYGSTEALIEALQHTSLSQWADRTASLASKFESARLEAVKLLQPKVQHLHLPRATIQTEAELEQWLADVKQQVLDKLNDGPVTF